MAGQMAAEIKAFKRGYSEVVRGELDRSVKSTV